MSTATWQTVRVFISSTFRDMHSERDWLIKRVFPALREQLEKYRVYLADIDLRWGVTEQQAESGGALDVCLDQIDQCRPFFLGLLGERYGWVPQDVPEHVTSKYGWIQHTTKKSITELEILYGVFNDQEMHDYSMFCFRDPAFIDDVPQEIQADLRAEDDESARKLAALKIAIKTSRLPTPPLTNYSCRYAGLKLNWRLAKLELEDADRQALEEVARDGVIDRREYADLEPHLRELARRFGTVQLDGLQKFGERVREWLWESIRRRLNLPELPPAAPRDSTDTLVEEQDYHVRFMESRLRVYVGREQIHDALFAFADGNDLVPCLVTGPSGTGKSAALAKFATAYRDTHPDVLVVPHFIGASPASTNLRQVLSRLCLTLKVRFGYADEVEQETHQLIGQWKGFLDRVPQNRRLLIVLDALNQMDETDHAHQLHWLPWQLPAHVKLIASCIDDSSRKEPTLNAFRHRPHRRVVIQPLTNAERRKIVRDVPSLSAKTLDDVQVGLLLSNPATENPLFLLVALEELRGFGSFEHLNRRIADLPREGSTVTALFAQVIDRLTAEFDPTVVGTLLSMLASARRGLSERELLDLVEGPQVTVAASAGDLFPILRQLRPYLQLRGELLDFHHRNLLKAVHETYLAAEDRRRTVHGRLADYFQAQGIDKLRTLDELAYQQAHTGDGERCRSTLCDLEFIEAKCAAHLPYELVDDYLLLDVLGTAKLPDVREFQEFVAARLYILADAPHLTLQEAANEPTSSAPSRRAQLRLAKVGQQRSWMHHLNKPETRSAILITLLGHQQPVTSCSMSSDGAWLATSSLDGTLRIWDFRNGRQIRLIDAGGKVLSSAISSHGTRLTAIVHPPHKKGFIRLTRTSSDGGHTV